MVDVPIFHVNGEDPEAVVYVGELALDFRETFGLDVVIDMVCYRRHGHNEGDEPAFTQPLMYRKINDRISIRELYTERPGYDGRAFQRRSRDHRRNLPRPDGGSLQGGARESREEPPSLFPALRGTGRSWARSYTFTPVATGVPLETLRTIGQKMAVFPPTFRLNPKMERILAARLKMTTEGPMDWSSAEALSFGSLLLEGTPVRLSGQDSRRGTFSQRHSVLVDSQTAERYVPLNNLSPGQAELCVYDSLLSK